MQRERARPATSTWRRDHLAEREELCRLLAELGPEDRALVAGVAEGATLSDLARSVLGDDRGAPGARRVAQRLRRVRDLVREKNPRFSEAFWSLESP